MSDGGKGSKPRPFSIPQEEFGNRIEAIFGKKQPRPQWVPPPLPDTNKQEQK
jgi:hypothetical protein